MNIRNNVKDVPPPLRSTTLLLSPVDRGAARGVQLVPKSAASYLRPEASSVHFVLYIKLNAWDSYSQTFTGLGRIVESQNQNKNVF